MTLKMIFFGVADTATTFHLINRNQAQLVSDTGEDYPNPYPGPVRAGQWFEINEAEYWYFLECLPPLSMVGGAFAMCEFKIGNLTDAFFSINGRYFCMTIAVDGRFSDEQEDNAPDVLRLATRALKTAIAATEAVQ